MGQGYFWPDGSAMFARAGNGGASATGAEGVADAIRMTFWASNGHARSVRAMAYFDQLFAAIRFSGGMNTDSCGE